MPASDLKFDSGAVLRRGRPWLVIVTISIAIAAIAGVGFFLHRRHEHKVRMLGAMHRFPDALAQSPPAMPTGVRRSRAYEILATPTGTPAATLEEQLFRYVRELDVKTKSSRGFDLTSYGLVDYYGAKDPDSDESLRHRSNLALQLMLEERIAASRPETRAVYAVRLARLGPEHRDTLSSRRALGALLNFDNRFEEAASELRPALPIHEKALGTEDSDTLEARVRLATALEKLNQHNEAESHLREVLSIRERLLGPHDSGTLGTQERLARCLLGMGRKDEAREYAQKAVDGWSLPKYRQRSEKSRAEELLKSLSPPP